MVDPVVPLLYGADLFVQESLADRARPSACGYRGKSGIGHGGRKSVRNESDA